MNTQAIVDRIEQLRLKKNLSKNAFAKKIGVTGAMVSKITTRKINFGIDFISSILNTFPTLSCEWLLRGNGPMYLTAPAGGQEAASQQMPAVLKVYPAPQNEIAERILELEQALGLTHRGMARAIPLFQPQFFENVLSRITTERNNYWLDISTKLMSWIILVACPKVSQPWILRGEGPMFEEKPLPKATVKAYEIGIQLKLTVNGKEARL